MSLNGVGLSDATNFALVVAASFLPFASGDVSVACAKSLIKPVAPIERNARRRFSNTARGVIS